MAQRNESSKKVYVKGYTKKDGTKVPNHYRSTPTNTDAPKNNMKKR